MLIHLSKSRLFTEDPSRRFAREYGVDQKLWTEMWKRRQLLDYSTSELCEYFQIKTQKKMKKKSLIRWVFRSEIYSMTNPIMKKGVRVVHSDFFKHHEQAVIKEITRHLTSGETQSIKIIV